VSTTAVPSVDPPPARAGEQSSIRTPRAWLAALRRPGLWWDLGAVAGFTTTACYLTNQLWRGLPKVRGTNGPDQALFEWMLAHGARVVGHLDNPFVTGRMNAPNGVNLMANTSILGLSGPMSPVTLLAGPHASFAVLMVIAYAATATAWYYMLSRHVVASRVAALIGGAFCAFAPGMVSHGNGHPNIVAQFLVPLIVWRTLKLREPGRSVRNGVVLGLLVTWQAFINEEILLMTAAGVAVFAAVVGLSRREYRRQIVPFLSGLGVAALAAAALLGYPLWVQFTGPGHYYGLNPAIQTYGANLAAYPAFSQLSLAGGQETTRGLAQNATEENAFFGWPLVILVAFLILFLVLSRSVTALALATTGAVFAVCSLGRVVAWRTTTLGPGPWRQLQRLPILDSVVPTRFALASAPVVGVLLALAWDQWRRRTTPSARTTMGQMLRYASFAVVPVAFIAALLPLVPRPLPVVARLPAPGLLLDGRLDGYLAGDRSVVFVPLPRNLYSDPLAWAAESGLSFNLAEGYFIGPASHSSELGTPKYGILAAPPRPTSVLLQQVYARNRVPKVTPRMRERAVADLRYWRASVVVQVPWRYPDALRRTTTELLGIEPQWMDGAWVWDVRRLG
jgi:hypothetical protein